MTAKQLRTAVQHLLNFRILIRVISLRCAEFKIDRLSLSWYSMVPDNKQQKQNNNLILMASLALAEFAAWGWAKADQYMYV